MTFGEFRELTKDVPDDADIFYIDIHMPLSIDVSYDDDLGVTINE